MISMFEGCETIDDMLDAIGEYARREKISTITLAKDFEGRGIAPDYVKHIKALYPDYADFKP